MTKQQLRLIARAFHDFAMSADKQEQKTSDEIAQLLANRLKADYPTFNDTEFLEKCGKPNTLPPEFNNFADGVKAIIEDTEDTEPNAKYCTNCGNVEAQSLFYCQHCGKEMAGRIVYINNKSHPQRIPPNCEIEIRAEKVNPQIGDRIKITNAEDRYFGQVFTIEDINKSYQYRYIVQPEIGGRYCYKRKEFEVIEG